MVIQEVGAQRQMLQVWESELRWVRSSTSTSFQALVPTRPSPLGGVQRPDGVFIPRLFPYGSEPPSSKRQSRAAALGSWCKESPKGALFATDEEKHEQACLFKLHYPLQIFVPTNELQEGSRSISNSSCLSSSVLSSWEMLCQEHTQPWKQTSRHNMAQTSFLKNSECSEIFPASHLQLLIPPSFLPS